MNTKQVLILYINYLWIVVSDQANTKIVIYREKTRRTFMQCKNLCISKRGQLFIVDTNEKLSQFRKLLGVNENFSFYVGITVDTNRIPKWINNKNALNSPIRIITPVRVLERSCGLLIVRPSSLHIIFRSCLTKHNYICQFEDSKSTTTNKATATSIQTKPVTSTNTTVFDPLEVPRKHAKGLLPILAGVVLIFLIFGLVGWICSKPKEGKRKTVVYKVQGNSRKRTYYSGETPYSSERRTYYTGTE